MKLLYSLTALTAVAVMMTSCSKDEIVTGTKDIALQRNRIAPDSIVLELYKGHSHLKEKENPDAGVVYWAKRNGGFHANPSTKNFPMQNPQKMVYRRTANGSYEMDSKYTDAFRLQSAPDKGGDWYGLIVKLYGDGGKRLDLDYKTPEKRNNIQVFYRVSGLKPIPQTVPANVVASDTLFTANDVKDEETKQKLLEKGFNGTMTVGYETVGKWTADSDISSSFYFWYFDRPQDNTEELLTTPVGFRGVIAARVPFVSYDVVMSVCSNTGEKGERNSQSPSPEQLQNVLFNLKIPFRNVFETPGWGKPTGNKDLLDIVWDDEFKYFPAEVVGDIVKNRCMFIPVLREYPSFTIKQLREWYDKDREVNFESANFWL